MVTKRFRNAWALSSALASLGTLQPQALGFLNRLVNLVSVSNLYLAQFTSSALRCDGNNNLDQLQV